METLSKCDEDWNLAFRSISDATETLRTKMPDEMVAVVLLQNAQRVLEDVTELVQWEFVQEHIINLWYDFDNSVSSQLTNELDPDRDAENYNKRYG